MRWPEEEPARDLGVRRATAREATASAGVVVGFLAVIALVAVVVLAIIYVIATYRPDTLNPDYNASPIRIEDQPSEGYVLRSAGAASWEIPYGSVDVTTDLLPDEDDVFWSRDTWIWADPGFLTDGLGTMYIVSVTSEGGGIGARELAGLRDDTGLEVLATMGADVSVDLGDQVRYESAHGLRGYHNSFVVELPRGEAAVDMYVFARDGQVVTVTLCTLPDSGDVDLHLLDTLRIDKSTQA